MLYARSLSVSIQAFYIQLEYYLLNDASHPFALSMSIAINVGIVVGIQYHTNAQHRKYSSFRISKWKIDMQNIPLETDQDINET